MTWDKQSVDVSFLGPAGFTTVTVIPATTTFTTGLPAGVSIPVEPIAANQVYRIWAAGTFVRVSSVTARNAVIRPFWGATQLPGVSVAVLVSNAATAAWSFQAILTGIDSTHIWTQGFETEEIRVAATARDAVIGAAASTVVPAGASTLDLQFNMTVVVAGDTWNVQTITMERLA